MALKSYMEHDDKMIPLGTLCTVRVKGQSKRLSRVMLEPCYTKDKTGKPGRPRTVLDIKIKVINSRGGRPRYLPIERISEVKVLA